MAGTYIDYMNCGSCCSIVLRVSMCGQSGQKTNLRGGVIAHNVSGQKVNGHKQTQIESKMCLHELTAFQLEPQKIIIALLVHYHFMF